MAEPSVSTEFEELLRRTVAVPGPRAAFVERLRSQIEAASVARPTGVAHRRLRPAWVVIALVLLALIASLAVVGPVRAFETVKHLFGFIPGIGFVEDNAPLRVLEAPVTQTRAGVTLTVTDAVADSAQTVVVYQVDGLSIDAANSNGEAPANLGSHAVLRLPDGTGLPFLSSNGPGWGSGYRMRLTFDPLPQGIEQATLEIDILMDMHPGAAPEDWSLPLRFVPAPPSFTVAPVLELEPTAPSTIDVPDAGPTASDSPTPASPYGINLQLDRVVELDDGYVLVGSLRWDNPDLQGYGVMPVNILELTDGVGNVVPLQRAGPEVLPTEQQPNRNDWAFKVPGKRQVGPMTLTLESVGAELGADASFTFDAGLDPQMGQRWELDQTVEIAGHAVHLIAAELVESRGSAAYRFDFASDADVTGIGLDDPTHPQSGGFGGGARGAFSAGLVYPGDPPAGAIEIRIIGINVVLHGPWQVIWQPPEAPEAPTATPMPQICLSEAIWANLMQEGEPSFPADLSGELLLYDTSAAQGAPNLVLTDIEGTNQRRLAWGVWPSLSADGLQAAFAGVDGLYVVDVETLQITMIPGTNQNDYNPLWSPDGQLIAFVRGAGAFDLFVVHPDGSGLRRVTNTPAYEQLGGWLGNAVLYASPDAEGLAIRLAEPSDGGLTDLFRLELTKYLGLSASPDGSHLSFRGQAMGWNPGLYVSDTHGSNRKLVVDPGGLAVAGSVWSPDGRWLATSIHDPARPGPVPVLIQPDTCQVVPLTGLTGDVGGWGP